MPNDETMLTRTFHHIQGIGATTERRIWSLGIAAWDDFKEPLPAALTRGMRAMVFNTLADSYRALAANKPAFFAARLPARLRWRLFPEFSAGAVYLDIETTGLDRVHDTVTCISLYDGTRVRWYVQGDNLDDFTTDIQQYNVIVSYNGSCFDVPFLERFFGVRLPHAQIDLRFVLAALGYKGGLKRCEQALGIERSGMQDIDGYFAVMLWNDYVKTGRPQTLETLLAYNICDTVNLAALMTAAYNHAIRATPFATHELPEPELPPAPFAVDRETVDRIRRDMHAGNSLQRPGE